MSEAIRVDRVFRKFQRGERHGSLRDAAASLLRRRPRDRGKALRESEFWALEDVSFEVRPGESFGIIGPNGAGKSTMLKLLAGIMRPTQGCVSLCGRVSALIEVGAGFHPDLTGRENIYLNASILGMRREEVRRKFDEIVEFAGVGEFLDMPLKRYSSGMHARLGFSVAAHVDPDILLVDEVLSVGDRVFRARCMERMREFLRRGVAIVFVSHDLSAVGRFCDRAMVLSRGRVAFAGATTAAVRHYYEATGTGLLARTERDTPMARVSAVALVGADGRPATEVRPGQRVAFCFDVEFNANMASPSFGLSVIEGREQTVVYETSSTRLEECRCSGTSVRAGERRRVRYEFELNLPPGEYSIGYHVRDAEALTYAVNEPFALRMNVLGERQSTGPAHLAAKALVETLPADVASPVASDSYSAAACAAFQSGA